jgi:hypothetical protein
MTVWRYGCDQNLQTSLHLSSCYWWDLAMEQIILATLIRKGISGFFAPSLAFCSALSSQEHADVPGIQRLSWPNRLAKGFFFVKNQCVKNTLSAKIALSKSADTMWAWLHGDSETETSHGSKGIAPRPRIPLYAWTMKERIRISLRSMLAMQTISFARSSMCCIRRPQPTEAFPSCQAACCTQSGNGPARIGHFW